MHDVFYKFKFDKSQLCAKSDEEEDEETPMIDTIISTTNYGLRHKYSSRYLINCKYSGKYKAFYFGFPFHFFCLIFLVEE